MEEDMNESNIFGLSIRGIIAFIVVVSICTVCVINRTDSNIGILKDLAIMILSFYFGQKSTQATPPNTISTITASTTTIEPVKTEVKP